MNANFEPLTDAEQAELTQPVEQAPLMDKAGVETLATDTGKKLTQIQARLDKADADIAKLDPGLRPAELATRTAAIRQTARADIEPLTAEVLRAAAVAESQIKRHDRVAVLARAEFDADPAKDATIRSSWHNRLSTAGPHRLMIFAQQAAESANLALANSILEALEARAALPDIDPRKPNRGTQAEIYKMINAIPTPASQVHGLRSVVALRDQLRVITGPKSARGLNKIAAALKQA